MNGLAIINPIDGRLRLAATMMRCFKTSGCCECGRRHPELDWGDLHVAHLDKDERSLLFFSLDRASAEVVLRELVKCIVLCRWCHLNYDRRTSSIDTQMFLFTGTGQAWNSNHLKVAS